jgi:NADH dehydrogenase (ubiquinone) 1 alpha/beta subcomplex 1
MFKSLVTASRTASRTALRSSRTNAFAYAYAAPAFASQTRFYSSAPELTKEIISARIVDLLQSYSKTTKNVTITPETSFTKDLGYDSFDVVEVLMEMEYEFSILIPDKEADEIKTVGQAIDFIAHQDDAC